MTYHLAAGFILGVGITTIVCFIGMEVGSYQLTKILNERNHYKKFYEDYREERDSGY